MFVLFVSVLYFLLLFESNHSLRELSPILFKIWRGSGLYLSINLYKLLLGYYYEVTNEDLKNILSNIVNS